jgi:hypothetical protein
MKTRKLNFRRRGDGLIVVIILLAVIGIGTWWLFNHKKTLDRDARTFGRDMIQRLAVNHDVNYMVANLSPQMKTQYPPSQVLVVTDLFNKAGVPQQPLNIEENVTFESTFFEPHATFIAHLFYPTGAATLQMAISHPVSRWQVDDMTFAMERPPH